MKGKVLSIITAVLFGATMLAAPIVMAAGAENGSAGAEETAKPAKAKKAKKSKKKATKKKAGKKKKAAPETGTEEK